MNHLGEMGSKPREDKVADNDEEREGSKEEISPELREGEEKSVPQSASSASFKSEVKLAGEFGQLEGMSALLGKREVYVEEYFSSILVQSHSTVAQKKIKTMVWEVLSKACLLFLLS